MSGPTNTILGVCEVCKRLVGADYHEDCAMIFDAVYFGELPDEHLYVIAEHNSDDIRCSGSGGLPGKIMTI